MRLLLGVFSIVLVLVACSSGQKSGTENIPGVHTIIAQEVIQTTQYTYIRATEGEKELWIAIPGMDVTVGTTYYYKDGMEMANFHSKELNRDFAIIYFVELLTTDPKLLTPATANGNTGNNDSVLQPTKPNIDRLEVAVNPEGGSISIGELFKNKDKYANKKVIIRGQVAKFSAEIMSRNWIHLQDGTECDGDFDLTCTSAATVKVGDIVTLEGTIALDKDFGFGYFYKVILEDATIKE